MLRLLLANSLIQLELWLNDLASACSYWAYRAMRTEAGRPGGMAELGPP
jgi:hypothetical protein